MRSLNNDAFVVMWYSNSNDNENILRVFSKNVVNYEIIPVSKVFKFTSNDEVYLADLNGNSVNLMFQNEVIDDGVRYITIATQKVELGNYYPANDLLQTSEKLNNSPCYIPFHVSQLNRARTYYPNQAVRFNNMAIQGGLSNSVSAYLGIPIDTAGAFGTIAKCSLTSSNNSSITWQANGNITEVNRLLQTLQFMPASSFTQDFYISASFISSNNETVYYNIPVHYRANNDLPNLVRNQLQIKQNETVTITPMNLYANSSNTPDSELEFIMTQVLYGYFENISVPNIPVNRFKQNALRANNGTSTLQFVTDGSRHVPSYMVSVSDGYNTTNPEQAFVDFTFVNQPPILNIQPRDQEFYINESFNFSISNQTFIDPDDDQLAIFARSVNSASLPNGLQFYNQSLLFNGAFSSPGVHDIMLVANDPFGMSVNTSFNLNIIDYQNFTPTPIQTTSSSFDYSLFGGVTAVVTVLAMSVVGFFCVNKKCQSRGDKNNMTDEIDIPYIRFEGDVEDLSKQNHTRFTTQIAGNVADRLDFKGVQDLESQQGIQYTQLINQILGKILEVDTNYLDTNFDEACTEIARTLKEYGIKKQSGLFGFFSSPILSLEKLIEQTDNIIEAIRSNLTMSQPPRMNIQSNSTNELMF